MNEQQIANALGPSIRQNNAEVGFTNKRRVKIGNGQGDATPSNPLTPREVYYRSASDQNDRGIAVLAEDAPFAIQALDGYYDVDVWIADVPGTTYPVISRPCDVQGLTTGEQSPFEGLVSAAAHPDMTRMVLFRLRPSVGGGISVYVDVGWTALEYTDAEGNNRFFRSNDFGFEDSTDSEVFNPTAAALAPTEHRLILICFNPATGKMVAVPGAARTTTETLPSQASRSEFEDEDYGAINYNDLYPCGFTYRYYGQVDLEEDDFMRQYEPRALAQRGGSSSVSLARLVSDAFGDIMTDAFGDPIWEP